jgi:hypothetical protein
MIRWRRTITQDKTITTTKRRETTDMVKQAQ